VVWEPYRNFDPRHIARRIVGDVAARCTVSMRFAIHVQNELIDTQYDVDRSRDVF
jgi:hypothetical protein